MTGREETERDVLLVGGMPLDCAETAFRAVAGALGDCLSRIPAGNLGDRQRWSRWHRELLERNPAFEIDPEDKGHLAAAAAASDPPMRVGGDHGRRASRYPPRFRVRPGIGQDEVRFERMAHADAAEDSYAVFARLRDEGVIRRGTRLQVAIPAAAAFLNGHVAPASHAVAEPPYLNCLFENVARLVGAIPHRDLAIQWDVLAEMAQWEGVCPAHFADVKHGVARRLAQHCNRVPRAVELGLHLCYGRSGERHWMEPSDAGNMVSLLNALVPLIEREISYVHLPVPSDRVDDEYFAPLRHLKLRRGTRVYLGLVHPEDGIEGARERIDAARRHLPQFGISTECDVALCAPEAVPDLLRLQAELCGLNGSAAA